MQSLDAFMNGNAKSLQQDANPRTRRPVRKLDLSRNHLKEPAEKILGDE